jgi:radical SAM/Cys-rich protein
LPVGSVYSDPRTEPKKTPGYRLLLQPAFDIMPLSFTARIPERLRHERTSTVQINVGKHCNQACAHCHVDAGPNRTERMTGLTADRILAVLSQSPEVRTVDITGGAPELNPEFRRLVRAAHRLGLHIIDRCNLTVLTVPGQEDTAAFLAENQVEVVASLPCYSSDNVDRQRGKGVFAKSIEGMRRLNAEGYGEGGLPLHLVYNPLGPVLPPPQEDLEKDYRHRLRADFGITFTNLLTLTNMPIARFRAQLEKSGQLAMYQALLEDAFNPQTLPGLMCRSQVSVSWDGRLYDCDFNQMLEIPCARKATLWDIQDFGELDQTPIALDQHCFGCTAGAGSSCGGALT